MSFVFAVSRGILASTSPAAISWPSSTMRCAPEGRRYLRTILPFSSRTSMRGCFFSSGDSMMTSADMPVFSSTCSWTVWPSRTSLKWATPLSSVMIVNEYGSHSTISWPWRTSPPSFTLRRAPYTTAWRSFSRPFWSWMMSAPERFITTRSPFLSLTVVTLWNFTRPAFLASRVVCWVVWLAVPPMWNVRIVSCVPGSPIDCAAMTPTARPISTSLPVARSRP